jgi:hypothetical protein
MVMLFSTAFKLELLKPAVTHFASLIMKLQQHECKDAQQVTVMN